MICRPAVMADLSPKSSRISELASFLPSRRNTFRVNICLWEVDRQDTTLIVCLFLLIIFVAQFFGGILPCGHGVKKS